MIQNSHMEISKLNSRNICYGGIKITENLHLNFWPQEPILLGINPRNDSSRELWSHLRYILEYMKTLEYPRNIPALPGSPRLGSPRPSLWDGGSSLELSFYPLLILCALSRWSHHWSCLIYNPYLHIQLRHWCSAPGQWLCWDAPQNHIFCTSSLPPSLKLYSSLLIPPSTHL